MERVLEALAVLEEINIAYGITTERLLQMRAEIADAKVCMPIIGKFSSGKSALVNTLLGYSRKILKEDITPQTAVPTEIIYTDGEECAVMLQNDGTVRTLSLEEYSSQETEALAVKKARLYLHCRFLGEIPDIMLVDMPGFESGYEVHNKAIDDYLPQSLAYILTFPADDMIVRNSVGNILRELCLHDMPLCVVITKFDKRGYDFDTTFAKMQESLRRFVGERQIQYCRTSSFTGEAMELEEYLREIQEKAHDILAEKYRKLILPMAENTENYLKTLLKGESLSGSELEEQEEKLRGQLSTLDHRLLGEQEEFQGEMAACTEEIKRDVQCAMEEEEPTLVAMAMNNQNINGHLNQVIRSAVTVSMKKHFMPLLEKHLKRTAGILNSEMEGDIHISFSYDARNLHNGMVQAVMAGVVAGAVGNLHGIPILGLVAAIFMKLRSDKKREEARQEIHRKLQGEVFPQVQREVGNGIEITIARQVVLVNAAIEKELGEQKDTLEKAMEDVRSRMKEETDRKERLGMDLKADLERIEEIKDGLR